MRKINFNLVSKLWLRLDATDKKYFWRVFVVGAINAIFETYAIFVIYLFIRIVQEPTFLFKYDYWHKLSLLNINNFYIYIGGIAVLVYNIKAGLNFLSNRAAVKFSENIYARCAKTIFKQYMNMPYVDFIKENPAELNDVVKININRYSESVLNIIGMMVDIFALVLICIMLLIINWQLLIFVAVFLAILAKILLSVTLGKVNALGRDNLQNHTKLGEVAYSSMFNYKIIKLMALDENIVSTFNSAVSNLSKTNIKRVLIGVMPRIMLEMICFISLIIGIIIGVVITHSPAYVISVATLFLFVLMKIIPTLMKMSHVIQTLSFYTPFIDKIPFDGVSVEILGSEEIMFNCELELKDISFSYNGLKPIIQDINMSIKKSDKIGIIGPSGVGKSTLQDIIIGLLAPSQGSILIDGIALNTSNLKSWRKQIGYIPQEIYLYNSTVADNIVLNREYDVDKIVVALKKAHIYDFLLTKDGINTIVGNNGVMLSGGQKQRIGIARALYANPEILVLDEATSALDQATETEIMKEIYSETDDKTLIIITHRPSTLVGCNKIYSLDEFGVKLRTAFV